MSMQQIPSHRRVVVGVDTHKYVHVAVALDDLGTVLDIRPFAADAGGYSQLIECGLLVRGQGHLRHRRDRVLRSRARRGSPAQRAWSARGGPQ